MPSLRFMHLFTVSGFDLAFAIASDVPVCLVFLNIDCFFDFAFGFKFWTLSACWN